MQPSRTTTMWTTSTTDTCITSMGTTGTNAPWTIVSSTHDMITCTARIAVMSPSPMATTSIICMTAISMPPTKGIGTSIDRQ